MQQVFFNRVYKLLEIKNNLYTFEEELEEAGIILTEILHIFISTQYVSRFLRIFFLVFLKERHWFHEITTKDGSTLNL